MKVKELWYYFQQPNRVLPKMVYIFMQTFESTQEAIGKLDVDLEELISSSYFIKHYGNCDVIEMSFDTKNQENNYISILIKGALGSNNYKRKK